MVAANKGALAAAVANKVEEVAVSSVANKAVANKAEVAV